MKESTEMSAFEIALLVFGCLIAAGFIGFVLATALLSRWIFLKHLKRGYCDPWDRSCSDPKDPEQVKMYDDGMLFGDENASYKTDVKIVNEGLNLYGEYFDFGYDRAAIIVSGRMESCTYGYYFAPPYKAAGYNILVIDQRSHGLSDGDYNTLGKNEYRDLLAWAKFLHEQKKVSAVVLHGICIGAATGLYALIDKDCPDYLCALVTEGMYPSFYESFRNHMINDGHPLFPVLQEVNLWMKHYTNEDMKGGPDTCIDRLKQPILMLQSREDKFSKPEKAKMLFDLCGSENKRLVYFDHGAHSHLRYVETDKYDANIVEFLSEL